MAREINAGQGNNMVATLALIAQLAQQDREAKMRENQMMMQMEQMKQQTATAMAGLEMQRADAKEKAELGREQLKQKNLTDYTNARNALITSAGWKDMSESERSAALAAVDKAYGMSGGAGTSKKTPAKLPMYSENEYGKSAVGKVADWVGNKLMVNADFARNALTGQNFTEPGNINKYYGPMLPMEEGLRGEIEPQVQGPEQGNKLAGADLSGVDPAYLQRALMYAR